MSSGDWRRYVRRRAFKLGRYNFSSNCLATLIPATLRHRVVFSALSLSQKQALGSIGQRYWLYQRPMMSALSYCVVVGIWGTRTANWTIRMPNFGRRNARMVDSLHAGRD